MYINTSLIYGDEILFPLAEQKKKHTHAHRSILDPKEQITSK